MKVKFQNFFKKMSRKQIVVLSLGLVFFLVGLGVGIFLSQLDNSPSRMSVYFFSASLGHLVAEDRAWPEGATIEEWLDTVISHLSAEPESRALRRTWPAATAEELISGMQMGGEYMDTLIVDFTEYYLAMPPLEESLFRSAFTKTMTGIGFVDSVKFRITDYYGEVIESVESASSISNNPAISPIRSSNMQFTLYFIDESMEGLVTKVYSAENVNVQQRRRVALQHLIAGQQDDGFFAAIPSETRVLGVTEDGDADAIYVDLSSEILNFTGTSAQARLMIYSIVNTVVANPTSTKRVAFLINSDRLESFHGVGDFNLLFNYNERIMMGFTEYEDYEEE